MIFTTFSFAINPSFPPPVATYTVVRSLPDTESFLSPINLIPTIINIRTKNITSPIICFLLTIFSSFIKF